MRVARKFPIDWLQQPVIYIRLYESKLIKIDAYENNLKEVIIESQLTVEGKKSFTYGCFYLTPLSVRMIRLKRKNLKPPS